MAPIRPAAVSFSEKWIPFRCCDVIYCWKHMGAASATAATGFWGNILEPTSKSLPACSWSWKLQQAGWIRQSSIKNMQRFNRNQNGNVVTWQQIPVERNNSLLHSTAPEILRSGFCEKPRDAALSWRGWGLGRRRQRSKVALRNLKVRSPNWGSSSWGPTINWKLLRTEITKCNTSWNGLLLWCAINTQICTQMSPYWQFYCHRGFGESIPLLPSLFLPRPHLFFKGHG